MSPAPSKRYVHYRDHSVVQIYQNMTIEAIIFTMESDIASKIQRLVTLGTKLDEDQTRSLMILIRKEIELMSDVNRKKLTVLNLFCNWSAHTQIDQSMSGLRMLNRINDALVRVKQADTGTILTEMTKAIGFSVLHSELLLFLRQIDISETISDDMWRIFLYNLIEIIRDVPLSFPIMRELKPPERKIYEQIAKNPIKPGAGVVKLILSNIDYKKFGLENGSEILCLLVRTEDTTTIIIPLTPLY
jgi:hypothetical protein